MLSRLKTSRKAALGLIKPNCFPTVKVPSPFYGIVHVPKTRRSLEVVVVNSVGEVLIKIEFLFVLECFLNGTVKHDSSSAGQKRNVDGPKRRKLHFKALLSVAVALTHDDEWFTGDSIDLCFHRIQIFVGGLNPLMLSARLMNLISFWFSGCVRCFPSSWNPFHRPLGWFCWSLGQSDFWGRWGWLLCPCNWHRWLLFRDSAIFCDIVEALWINQ